MMVDGWLTSKKMKRHREKKISALREKNNHGIIAMIINTVVIEKVLNGEIFVSHVSASFWFLKV